MQEWVLSIIAAGGYWGIGFLMVLENLIPPIPSELIMGIGGVLVARGQMEFVPLLVVGTIGTTLGNYAWYWVGDRLGYKRLEPLIDRYGRWLTMDFQHIEQAASFFQRHGQWVVFVLRFSPVLRTIISLPAGLAHMSKWRFLAFTFAGAAVWNVILIEAGRRLAPFLERYETVSSWVVGGTVVLFAGYYIYRVLTWKPRDRD